MDDKKMTLDEALLRIEELEQQVVTLKSELDQVTQLYQKVKERRFNERGAGRKKNDAKWQARYHEFAKLFEGKKSEAEIEAVMKISRSTYYRFKKYYQDSNQTGKE